MDEKVKVLTAHIQHQGNRRDLVELIAGQRNFREPTVWRWDDSKIVRWALPVRLSNSLAGELLRSMHIERRREMLADFLDALGTPNGDGLSAGDVASGSEEFEKLLSSKGFQPAWDPEEAVVAHARCLEKRDRYPDALQLLQTLVH